MKKVILTIGPRGAGKTTYIEKVKNRYPEITIVSRDEIRARVFHDMGYWNWKSVERTQKTMHSQMKLALTERTDVTVILDLWTNKTNERKDVLTWLRSTGVDQVIGWYFTTPLEQCLGWCALKPELKEDMSTAGGISALSVIYSFFHDNAKGIDSEGFNNVYRINPLDASFEPPLY